MRVTLENLVSVDVNNWLTVRYGGLLGSPNINTNPAIVNWSVAAIPREDADWSDLEEKGQ